ncbi:MAG TPA: hypothetical protein PLX97_03115, partial [Gemmatales bacterium]|nr:hypothetical protein [Gemmatales bacterium]
MTSAQSEHLDTTIKLYRELREYSYDKVLSDLSPKFTYNPNDVKQLIQPMLTLYKLMNEAAIPLVP